MVSQAPTPWVKPTYPVVQDLTKTVSVEFTNRINNDSENANRNNAANSTDNRSTISESSTDGTNDATIQSVTTYTLSMCQISDLVACSHLWLQAFTDSFSLKLFPSDEYTLLWAQTVDIRAMQHDPSAKYLKIVSSVDNTIAAHCIWQAPSDGEGIKQIEEGGDGEGIDWPKNSDAAYNDTYYGMLKGRREKWMGDRKHYYLNHIGTVPAHRGRGLANVLVRWGLDHADKQGVDAYLEAFPGLNLYYARFGFKVVEEILYDGHTTSIMIRKPEASS